MVIKCPVSAAGHAIKGNVGWHIRWNLPGGHTMTVSDNKRPAFQGVRRKTGKPFDTKKTLGRKKKARRKKKKK